jgi:hypothetical protein
MGKHEPKEKNVIAPPLQNPPQSCCSQFSLEGAGCFLTGTAFSGAVFCFLALTAFSQSTYMGRTEVGLFTRPGKKGRALEGPIAMFTYKHHNLGFDRSSFTAPSPISPGRHSATPPSPPPALSSRSRPLRLPYSQRPGRARAVAARASARGGNHGSRQEQEDLQGKEGWEEEDVSLLARSSRSSDLSLRFFSI